MAISNPQNKEKENIKTKIQKYLDRLTKLVDANYNLINEKKLLEESKNNIETELNDLKKIHSSVEAKLTQNIEEYEKKNNKDTEDSIEKLMSMTEILQNKIEELQNKITEKESQLSSVNSEKEVLQQKIEEFKNEIEQLNLKNKNNEDKIQELTKEINSLTAINNLSTRTSEELDTIKSQLEKKQIEISEKDIMVNFLNEQIDELEQKSEVIYEKYLKTNEITETEQTQTQKKKLQVL